MIFTIPMTVYAHKHEETPIPKEKPYVNTGEKNELQKLIDAAAPGDTILLKDKTYRGALIINKPIHLQGVEGTKIASIGEGITISNTKNVSITDARLEIEDVSIIGDGLESLLLENIQIKQGTAGIQLTDSKNIVLKNVDITGGDGHFSTKGHAIAIYKSTDVQANDCDIASVMDGFYMERVDRVNLQQNVVKDGRYAMHMMYSNDVTLKENTVTSNMTGFMLMVGKHITMTENNVAQNNTLNSLGVYLYDDEDVTFQQNNVQENTVAMSIENTREMTVSNNTFSSNGTVLQVKHSGTLQIQDNEFYGNILTLRTDQEGATLTHNFYDDYTGKDYDGDGIGDTNYMATNSFGQWMVRKPVYQYFIESPSVVTLNLMDTEVVDKNSAITVDETPIVLKKLSNVKVDINGWQLAGSLFILIVILGVRRKLT